MVYKKIKLIEKTPLLSLGEKVEILLVYANQKPAALIGPLNNYFQIYKFHKDKNIYELDEKTLNKTTKLLDQINLSYCLGDKTVWNCGKIIYPDGTIEVLPSVEYTPVYAAKNREIRDEFYKAHLESDPEKIGLFYGYPETAVQAFLGERERFFGNLCDKSHLGFFTQFVFSAEYFCEELKTSQRWHDTIKKLSPKLYDMIKEHQKKSKIIIGQLVEED